MMARDRRALRMRAIVLSALVEALDADLYRQTYLEGH